MAMPSVPDAYGYSALKAAKAHMADSVIRRHLHSFRSKDDAMSTPVTAEERSYRFVDCDIHGTEAAQRTGPSKRVEEALIDLPWRLPLCSACDCSHRMQPAPKKQSYASTA